GRQRERKRRRQCPCEPRQRKQARGLRIRAEWRAGIGIRVPERRPPRTNLARGPERPGMKDLRDVAERLIRLHRTRRDRAPRRRREEVVERRQRVAGTQRRREPQQRHDDEDDDSRTVGVAADQDPERRHADMVRWALAGGATLRARRVLSTVLVMLAWMSLAAAAPPPPLVPYDKGAFEAAQAENRPIVVFVHASWCVTCRRQQPIVQQLAADDAFKDKSLVVFVVDYADKTTLKELSVTDRSTLVAFHGRAERSRSSFVTDP